MKTTIYYFSGTGNSLAVAKDIVRELNSRSNITEILPIAKLSSQKSIKVESDTIGIVFPVYCHDIHPIIEEFTKKLELSDTYIFGIATYNIEPGNALFNLNAILEKMGSRLAAGFQISMPGNSVLVIDNTTTDEENKKRFIEEKRKIKIITEAVKLKKSLGIEGSYNPDEEYEIKAYLKNIHRVADQFWVTEKCNQCGICEEVCPRKNIERVNEKIIWHKNCEHCLACLHWCPQGAVQNGDNSQNCRRYHHPDISVEEIIAEKN
jgi:ferredoxin